MPNPCQHSGRCSTKQEVFSCDCSGTGYIGKTCASGIVTVSGYPPLTVNVTSTRIKVSANPDNYLVITPVTTHIADVLFKPSTLYLGKNYRETSFTVKSRITGDLRIQYKLTGENAPSFIAPPDATVFANVPRPKLSAVNISMTYLDDACQHFYSISACKKSITFKSSCAWPTHGFVTVNSETVNIPLSIFGVSQDTITSLYNKKLLDPNKNVEIFLKTRNIAACSSCRGAETNANIINYMVENNYFQHIFLHTVSKMLPLWLNIKPVLSEMTSVKNLNAVFGKGKMLQSKACCRTLKLKAENGYVVYQPQMSMLFQIHHISKIIPRSSNSFCIAIDLCELTVHIALPKYKALKLNLLGFPISITQFSLLNSTSCMHFSRLPVSNNNCVKADLKWSIKAEFKTTSTKFMLDGDIYISHGNIEKVSHFN